MIGPTTASRGDPASVGSAVATDRVRVTNPRPGYRISPSTPAIFFQTVLMSFAQSILRLPDRGLKSGIREILL